MVFSCAVFFRTWPLPRNRRKRRLNSAFFTQTRHTGFSREAQGARLSGRVPGASPKGALGRRQLLRGFGRHGLMIVADLFDLPVHNFHDFRTDQLNFAAL